MALDIFNLHDDWTSPPGQSLETYRTPIQYPGSGIYLRNITDDIRIKFTTSFINLSKSEESAILSFFSLHRGRHRAFWAIVPKNYFQATANIGAASTTISIADISPIWLRPLDRMVIVDSSGNIYHSRIVNITSSAMTISSPLGAAISTGSIRLFGRLIYCRFDQDEVSINYETSGISTCELSFIELPKERLS